MRDKLNESKAAQIGLVAVLVLIVAVLFLGKSGGGGGASTTEASTEGGESVAVSTGTTGTGTSSGMGELPTSVPAGAAPPSAFTAAYDAGGTVALLVVHNGGVDDAYTRLALRIVKSVARVTTFVVPAKQISRYASVTVGLDVSQVPALIVLRPKSLSHGVPQASISYGFQTAESIYQQVRDASYVGPEEETYHPG